MTFSKGLYIHIPYCRHKCLYCDFYTGGERIAEWEVYLKSIINELNIRKDENPGLWTTIYLGGGTPSLIPEKQFEFLIHEINKVLNVSSWLEFTIEVNPEDVTPEKIISWKKSGVTRVSVGVQSLNDKELKVIGRKHTGDEARNALIKLQENFGNISIDIMSGLPGQTEKSYIDTLNEIIKIKPQHISSYTLMLEENTAMTHLVDRGNIKLPDEDLSLKLMEMTSKILKEQGYIHYEISNYSLPGMESRHNLSYWEGKPYLGLGPGAHSYDGSSIRRWNPNDLKGYIRFYKEKALLNPGKSEKVFFEEEDLSEKEEREEYILTRLRTSKGISIIEFGEKFGEDELKNLLQKSLMFENSGDMKKDNDFISLTEKGILVSDSIFTSLI
ncbi:MAG: radical SAM family heme chaperone HemW [Muribaculaceae bacterium]|nr:radical SAM family heme chaperone HemW [Muribaculaceae bacterium]